jgi:hypothetical protein
LFPELLLYNAIPFYLWVLIGCAFVLLIRRDHKTLISLSGIFGIIITIFAGPAADFRYLFCLPLIAPILFTFIFNRPANEIDASISMPL